MEAVNQMSPPYTRERMKSVIEWMLQEDSRGRAENLRNAKEMAKKVAGFYWKNRNEGVALTFKSPDDTAETKRLQDAIERGLAAWQSFLCNRISSKIQNRENPHGQGIDTN